MSRVSRRDFLRLLGLSGLGLVLGRCTPRGMNGDAGGMVGSQATPVSPTATTAASTMVPAATQAPSASSGTSSQSPAPGDLVVRLVAVEDEVPIFPGAPTRVWRFQGQVLQGPQEALQPVPDSYLGPTFRLRKGQRVRITFENDIPEESIVHWHGLHVPDVYDGHPRYVIPKGATYKYELEIVDRAGTYWYHPHPHGRTGPQVYYGLAGFFIIDDDEAEALPLPRGEYDIPLVLQDRLIDSQNQWVYLPGGHRDAFFGQLGDRILVNGRPDFRLQVATRPYRLRILNGSNSRIYKLAWEDGSPVIVIGTDGGLLEKPVQKPFVTLGPAQRVEIWADFGRYPVGTTLRMVSLAHPAPGGERAFAVFTVDVVRQEKSDLTLPQQLTPIPRYRLQDAVNADRPRAFLLSMGPGMTWTLNGRTFEMTAVADNEVVRLGDLEVWSFVNQVGMGGMGGGMGRGPGGMGGMAMALPHPMHVHGLQFQILRRQVDPAWQDYWNAFAPGFVDEGWHDTVLVLPGERVDILLKFTDFEGLYLYHCHNLEHEDMGMMRNYRVVRV